jgi:hypothetical protein
MVDEVALEQDFSIFVDFPSPPNHHTNIASYSSSPLRSMIVLSTQHIITSLSLSPGFISDPALGWLQSKEAGSLKFNKKSSNPY